MLGIIMKSWEADGNSGKLNLHGLKSVESREGD